MRKPKKQKICPQTVSALAWISDQIGYSAAKVLNAMRPQSRPCYYRACSPCAGYLKGNKTAVSRAIGCRPETLLNIVDRIKKLKGDDRKILKAWVKEESGEINIACEIWLFEEFVRQQKEIESKEHSK